ncbi:MAG: hypothetical protein NUW14_00445 [Deltaproteobacteria bacterium]|nr:hypothetical protein [Deltaproteobacteria bacterium]
MKVNCLSCGHKVDLDEAYDDYSGPVKCLACGAILEIEAQEGKIRIVRISGATLPGANEKSQLPSGFIQPGGEGS